LIKLGPYRKILVAFVFLEYGLQAVCMNLEGGPNMQHYFLL